MTVFNCPHCNNHIEVDEAYAGRDGWCRKCKNLVTVPGGNNFDLSPDEKYERLAKTFKLAAARADKYQLLFLKSIEENEHLAGQVKEAAALINRVSALERRVVDITNRPKESSEQNDSLRVEELLKRIESLEQSKSESVLIETQSTVAVEPEAISALKDRIKALEENANQFSSEKSKLTNSTDSSAIANVSSSLETMRHTLDELASRVEKNAESQSNTSVSTDAAFASLTDIEEILNKQQAFDERASLIETLIERLRDDIEVHHKNFVETSTNISSFLASFEEIKKSLFDFEVKLAAIPPEDGKINDKQESLESDFLFLRSLVEKEIENIKKSISETSKDVSSLSESNNSSFSSITSLFNDKLASMEKVVSDTCAMFHSFEEEFNSAGIEQTALKVELDAMRGGLDSLSSVVDRLSETSENIRANSESNRAEFVELSHSVDVLRKEIESDRESRAEMRRDQEKIRLQSENVSQAILGLRNAFDAVSSTCAVSSSPISDNASKQDVFKNFDEDSDEDSEELSAEVITPEVIDEDSDVSRQMMLNAFLRFINSSPHERR
jgi:chromosome segregation ATPase